MSEKEPGIEEEVLEAILETWALFPKQRLAQMLVNAINPGRPCPEIFHMEDSELIKRLNAMAKEYSG